MRHNARNSGFAMVMAIILLGFVGIALAAVTSLFSRQAKRTMQAQSEAQLRQMLLAGAQSVAEKSQTWAPDAKPADWSLRLPTSLSAAKGELSVQLSRPAPTTAPASGPSIRAQILAKLDGAQLRQTLTLRHADGKWRIEEARLE